MCNRSHAPQYYQGCRHTNEPPAHENEAMNHGTLGWLHVGRKIAHYKLENSHKWHRLGQKSPLVRMICPDIEKEEENGRTL